MLNLLILGALKCVFFDIGGTGISMVFPLQAQLQSSMYRSCTIREHQCRTPFHEGSEK